MHASTLFVALTAALSTFANPFKSRQSDSCLECVNQISNFNWTYRSSDWWWKLILPVSSILIWWHYLEVDISISSYVAEEGGGLWCGYEVRRNFWTSLSFSNLVSQTVHGQLVTEPRGCPDTLTICESRDFWAGGCCGWYERDVGLFVTVLRQPVSQHYEVNVFLDHPHG